MFPSVCERMLFGNPFSCVPGSFLLWRKGPIRVFEGQLMTTIELLLERIAAQNERIIEQNEEILRRLALRLVQTPPEPVLKKPKSN